MSGTVRPVPLQEGRAVLGCHVPRVCAYTKTLLWQTVRTLRTYMDR